MSTTIILSAVIAFITIIAIAEGHKIYKQGKEINVYASNIYNTFEYRQLDKKYDKLWERITQLIGENEQLNQQYIELDGINQSTTKELRYAIEECNKLRAELDKLKSLDIDYLHRKTIEHLRNDAKLGDKNGLK